MYYLLEHPVALYKENIPLLRKMKEGLTNLVWNEFTSDLPDKQYQGIYQGFRMPGTLTKFGEKIRAFKPVCEELSGSDGELTDEDKEALEYARVTVSKCVNTIMLLFNDLDNVNTPYMTAIDAIKEYKEIIDEALDYLISISNDAVATGKEAA